MAPLLRYATVQKRRPSWESAGYSQAGPGDRELQRWDFGMVPAVKGTLLTETHSVGGGGASSPGPECGQEPHYG